MFLAGALGAAHAGRVTLIVQDLRLVVGVVNVMAGQPDDATQEEMRRHLNLDGSAPRDAPPPPSPPPPPHLVPVVLLLLQVFLLLGDLPRLLVGVHLLGVMTLPVARELLPSTHPLPMTVVTATLTTAIILVHLYAVTCMVPL